jgi:hypothetical protein
MDYILFAVGSAFGLFGGMLLLLEVGWRLGARRRAKNAEGVLTGSGTLEGAVFGLLGLLVAFTFSGAISRFDTRRQLIVEETNTIGTAYLRLDLLPASAQPALRESFRQYVDSRLQAYQKLPDLQAAMAELARATQLQKDIWRRAVAACQEASAPQATMLLLPALNQMIDITTTRTMSGQIHPPTLIFALLFGLALTSSLLAGYSMAGTKSRNWLYMLGFAATLAGAVYVILDLEYPRFGLIQVNAFDQALMDLRESLQ